MNKKADTSQLFNGAIIVGILTALYIVLLIINWIIDSPPLKAFQSTITYIFIVILWFLLQFLVIYGTFKLVTYVSSSIPKYKKFFTTQILKVEKLILH